MLRVGVFGTGHIGRKHIVSWKEIPKVEVVGFTEPNMVKASEVTHAFGIKHYQAADNLIRDCDIVDITAPTQHHFEIASQAVKQGKHVYVKYPMTNTLSEAELLVKLVQESNVKFQVESIDRYNAAFLHFKNMNLSPRYINIVRAYINDEFSAKANIVLDYLIHDLLLLKDIVHSEIRKFDICGSSVLHNTSDIVNMRIEYSNGCIANLFCSRIEKTDMHELRVYLKDYYVTVDMIEKKIMLRSDLKTKQESNAMIDENYDIDLLDIEEVNSIKLGMEDFVKAILQNETPPVSEVEGFQALSMAHLALSKIIQ